MKPLTLLPFLSTLTLAPLVFAAQETAPQQLPTVTIPEKALRIDVPADARKMWPNDFYDYLRTYSLSNGMELTVLGSGTRVLASLDGGVRHPLVAIERNVFVARDRSMKMTIELRGDDDARGEVLLRLPTARSGNDAVATERIVRVALR